MGRIVYCLDDYVPERAASISIFDRGFLFGDAVYEVVAIIAGRLIDNEDHLDRLERSLSSLSIPMPAPRVEIRRIQAELIKRNALSEGLVYMQVSRGSADRSFTYPRGLSSNLVMFTQARMLTGTDAHKNGIAVMLAEDQRWARRDIKTSMLLRQVLAKQEARAQGYDDVWLVEDGLVTEGASSSAFIVTADGAILTRPDSTAVLPGCTSKAVHRLCRNNGLDISECAFTPAQAQGAAEAFATSASTLVTPIVRIDDVIVGDGRPGPITRRLQAGYLEAAREAA